MFIKMKNLEIRKTVVLIITVKYITAFLYKFLEKHILYQLIDFIQRSLNKATCRRPKARNVKHIFFIVTVTWSVDQSVHFNGLSGFKSTAYL